MLYIEVMSVLEGAVPPNATPAQAAPAQRVTAKRCGHAQEMHKGCHVVANEAGRCN